MHVVPHSVRLCVSFVPHSSLIVHIAFIVSLLKSHFCREGSPFYCRFKKYCCSERIPAFLLFVSKILKIVQTLVSDIKISNKGVYDEITI